MLRRGETVRRGVEDPRCHEGRLCLRCQWDMQLQAGPVNPEAKTMFQDRVMVWGMFSPELMFYATAVFESI